MAKKPSAKISAPNTGRHASPSHIEAEIRDCLNEWISQINNGTAGSVAALYSKDADLLATFEPELLTTPEKRENYFVHFKAKRGLTATVDESHIKTLADIGGTVNGLYTFRFIDENNMPQTVKARLTFVYERRADGELEIIAHHSSKSPDRPANQQQRPNRTVKNG